MNALRSWLAHPLLRGLDVDDPRTTELRRQVIRANPFLVRIYEAWYRSLLQELPESGGAVLELGSGGGFLPELAPRVITSEVFFCGHVDLIANGQHLPFAARTLRGMLMTDVFHHIPDVREFMREAARCIVTGGVMTMIEPWVTAWSRLIFTSLHHEPFLPQAASWQFPDRGPLSGANGALPWIVFERDREVFLREFPQWRLESVRPMMPFRYLVSGGVSMRPLMPAWSWGFWEGLESLPMLKMSSWGMFAQITLRRTE